ncbi:hypothetical protein [Microbispora sp. GKU 823]|uniref:hypothetical protein n=1 Tax=Microbispora sp. GKU 823 TaxID=1652100 RepID=UPI001C4DF032|nr:hypothetical protein [Microbispora sp. GKU 823]
MPEPPVSPVSAAEARAALAAAQAELLAALVAGGRVPDGFDPGRVAVQARGLLAKRRGSVRPRRPRPRRGPRRRVRRLFAEYAADT